jgi:hypothetical protein
MWEEFANIKSKYLLNSGACIRIWARTQQLLAIKTEQNTEYYR